MKIKKLIMAGSMSKVVIDLGLSHFKDRGFTRTKTATRVLKYYKNNIYTFVYKSIRYYVDITTSELVTV